MIASSKPSQQFNNDEYDPIQLRYDMNWTIEQLAFELDYSVSAVSKWSAGLVRPAKRARRCAYKILISNQKEVG